MGEYSVQMGESCCDVFGFSSLSFAVFFCLQAVETSRFRGICTIYELHSGDETTDTGFCFVVIFVFTIHPHVHALVS